MLESDVEVALEETLEGSLAQPIRGYPFKRTPYDLAFFVPTQRSTVGKVWTSRLKRGPGAFESISSVNPIWLVGRVGRVGGGR